MRGRAIILWLIGLILATVLAGLGTVYAGDRALVSATAMISGLG
jgi:hypothetical protein